MGKPDNMGALKNNNIFTPQRQMIELKINTQIMDAVKIMKTWNLKALLFKYQIFFKLKNFRNSFIL